MVVITREATEVDMPDLLVLLEGFFDETWFGTEGYILDRGSLKTVLQSLIESDDNVLLVCIADGETVGTTAAVAVDHWFVKNHTTGQEMFWYVKPEFRSKGVGRELFDALQQWASTLDSFSMATQDTIDPKVGEYYKRNGFVQQETFYIKGNT